jgi:hypothetical protein
MNMNIEFTVLNLTKYLVRQSCFNCILTKFKVQIISEELSDKIVKP